MLRFLTNAFFYVLAVACILVLFEAAYFATMLAHRSELQRADLMVVFPGDKDRIATGYKLAKKGMAGHFMVSGATAPGYASMDKKYGKLPDGVKKLESRKSRSTFEDALITVDIIESQGHKSVILITSAYHLPRAYFLLRMLLLGQGVEFQAHGHPERTLQDLLKNPTAVDARLLAQEMLKFWGGLAELAWYKATGKLLSQHPVPVSPKKT